jgi:hypothetical protein
VRIQSPTLKLSEKTFFEDEIMTDFETSQGEYHHSPTESLDMPITALPQVHFGIDPGADNTALIRHRSPRLLLKPQTEHYMSQANSQWQQSAASTIDATDHSVAKSSNQTALPAPSPHVLADESKWSSTIFIDNEQNQESNLLVDYHDLLEKSTNERVRYCPILTANHFQRSFSAGDGTQRVNCQEANQTNIRRSKSSPSQQEHGSVGRALLTMKENQVRYSPKENCNQSYANFGDDHWPGSRLNFSPAESRDDAMGGANNTPSDFAPSKIAHSSPQRVASKNNFMEAKSPETSLLTKSEWKASNPLNAILAQSDVSITQSAAVDATSSANTFPVGTFKSTVTGPLSSSALDQDIKSGSSDIQPKATVNDPGVGIAVPWTPTGAQKDTNHIPSWSQRLNRHRLLIYKGRN